MSKLTDPTVFTCEITLMILSAFEGSLRFAHFMVPSCDEIKDHSKSGSRPKPAVGTLACSSKCPVIIDVDPGTRD